MTDDSVYVGTGPTLTAVDAADGSERWTVETDRFLTGSPVVRGDTVYATNDALFALDGGVATEPSGWPMPGGNPTRTNHWPA